MGENKIDVSIIVPVYNVENYLHDCLNSLLSQTYENIEIICIDDASTDNSYDILKYFSKKDNRVKIIKNKENIGLGASRNIGLQEASGKYIQFLDSDDWLDYNSIEICYKNAEKYQLDFLMFKLINYDHDNNRFYKTNYYSMEYMKKWFNKPFSITDLSANTIFRLPNSACNKFFLKNFLLENNITFPEGLIHEDNPVYFKAMFSSDKIMILDNYFYNRRIRSNSITIKTDESLMDVMEITEEVLDYFISKKFYESYKKNIINYVVFVIKSKFYLIDEKFKDSYFKIMKKKIQKYINLYNLKKDFYNNLNEENINFIKLILYSDDFKQFKNNIQQIKNLNNDYKVSVIIPVYNAKKTHLVRAFKSLLRQTIGFKNIEIIFIDDNSSFKEGSYYLKELNDLYPNVTAIFLNENSGSGHARNIGIKRAKSNYIMFLDHDDFYLNNACKVLYDTIKKENVDMVCGNYINMSREGTIVDWSKKNIDDYKITVKSVLENKNIFKIDPSIWSKIYKKSFLRKTNTYFSNFKAGQDLVFFQETLFKANGITLINEPIVQYATRESDIHSLKSMSLNNSKKILKVLIDVYQYSFNLFLKYDETSIDISLNLLNYWVNTRLLNSDLSFDDFKEIVNYSNKMFVELFNRKKRVTFKNKELFEYMKNKNYKKAYDLYLILKK